MYLKGIEINGFKSFSNKVNLDFTKGITAIVGPNGSGKSNILDAVLWVLGEQSYKSIRAKDGQDVIFSGGKNKKARSSATVSLYIDNSDKYIDYDADELVITRSINRNGENIYSLNGKRTRLKDINNLLMDTGIGKQAYSVIGQGKVERIISSSSVELRNIIDEAAGIKKAKVEKDLALKKFESVKNELEKIEFVEKDLEKRVEELKTQSTKARQYRAFTKKINTLKYMSYTYYINQFKSEIEDFNVKKVNIEESIKKSEESIQEYTDKIQKNNDEKKIINARLNELLNSSDENNEKLKDLSDKQVELITKKANFTSEVNAKEKEKQKLIQDKEEVSKIVEENREKLVKSKADIDAKKENILDIEKILKSKTDKKLRIEEEIRGCEDNRKNYEVDKLKINMTTEDAKKRIKYAKSKLEQVTKEKEQADLKLKSLESTSFDEKEFNSLKEEYALKKEEYSKLNNERNAIHTKLEEIRTKYDVLNNSINNFKLMNNAIQFVCNKSKDDNLVYGPLVNMIEVDEKYHLAITTIAGYSLNDIVVENSEVARKYVDILKGNKVGVASFLPIQNLSKKNLNNGQYNFARNLVKNKMGNPKIDRVIEHVFSNAVIVDNLKEGIELSKTFKDRIVSLAGDVISSTGRITGGYITKKVDETLKRTSLLNTYKEEKESIEKRLNQKTNEILVVNKEVERLNSLIDEKRTVYENYSHNKKSILREITTYSYEMNENNDFISQKEKDINENDKLIHDINMAIVVNDENEKTLKSQLETLQNTDVEKKKLESLRIDLAVENEKYNNILAKYNEVYVKLEKSNEEYRELADFLDKKEENYHNLEEELESIKGKIVEIQESDVKSKEEINRLTKENIDKSSEYKELIEQKSKCEIEQNTRKNEYGNLLDKIEKDNTELEKYTNMLSKLEEFSEDIKSNEEYEEDVDLLKVKMFERKISINEKSRQELGDVNLGSIKEYEEENARFEKMRNDKFDLLRAEESVLKLIDDIDGDIVYKFKNAIEEIGKNFTYMCRELLHGAKGVLKIQDEDNLIETGLELSVKYRNKPEQTLSLLSGGEKSMLAVAFIISIFMYKPSPFTFFDEVEAALDEQNTKKLVELLNKFTYSQFIMITHNKETMKGADRLYGVTMNKEVGESIIVSVDI